MSSSTMPFASRLLNHSTSAGAALPQAACPKNSAAAAPHRARCSRNWKDLRNGFREASESGCTFLQLEMLVEYVKDRAREAPHEEEARDEHERDEVFLGD